MATMLEEKLSITMINPDGTAVFQAIVNETHYRINSTESTGRSVWDAIDRIENLQTKEIQERPRREWYNIFSKYKWEEVKSTDERFFFKKST